MLRNELCGRLDVFVVRRGCSYCLNQLCVVMSSSSIAAALSGRAAAAAGPSIFSGRLVAASA